MQIDTLLRGTAVATWSVTIVMFCLGLIEERDPIDFYAMGCLLAFVATTFTGVLVVEYIVEREWERGESDLAASIARALADELEERELTRLHTVH